MTSELRKMHKISWLLIAVLGIIFLFFTIRSLNFNDTDSSKVEQVENTKPNI